MISLPSHADRPRRRSRPVLISLSLVVLAGVLGLLALGTWQIQRRSWKLDLIARVDARVHAPPLPVPGPDAWPQVGTGEEAYRHVRVTGTYLPDRETLVQAVTDLGGGFWVMTPLRTPDGTVLINRGFVPSDRRDPGERRPPEGETTVTGLLRTSEPGGGFLRSNDPGQDRWFSRDVAAIARARGLTDPAPYFVDADAGADPGALPVGGLTVVSFHNNHLVYALTWYALALMLAAGWGYVLRSETRGRRPPP